VEEVLLTHPMIAAAAAIDLPSRKRGLGVIVELNAAGKAALTEEGAFRFSRHLRIALASRLEPGERPKHWRFETIPVNSQGKRVQAMLRARFEAPPGVVATQDERAAEITMLLEPELIWFKGHFPGQPVLPGIAQVHLAAQWAEYLWAWRPNGADLAQLKCRQILRPGNSVRLRLSRDATRLTFAYHLGDIVASQGIIGRAP
jgi:3-hydroxymyristoyl/3-hydroxydecanoyl-(acyl carrier protein) dehydratase